MARRCVEDATATDRTGSARPGGPRRAGHHATGGWRCSPSSHRSSWRRASAAGWTRQTVDRRRFDGRIVVPLALQVLADGTTSWPPTVDVGLWADIASLQYEFVPIVPSTVCSVALSIEDFGGKIASVYADVQI